jgi:hypothetical protein
MAIAISIKRCWPVSAGDRKRPLTWTTRFSFHLRPGGMLGVRYASAAPVRDVFDFPGRAVYEEFLRVPLIFYGGVEPVVLAVPDVQWFWRRPSPL